MTSHVEVIAAIPAQRRADLQDVQSHAGYWHLAGHLGAIALSSLWIALALPLWPAMMLVQGVLLVFLFTLQHECTHETPFPSARMCRYVGWAAGVVLLQPFLWFRYFHMAHHRFTNDPQRDPELLGGAKPEGWRAYLWHVSGLPVWFALLRTLWINAFGDPRASYLPERAVPRIRREARGMVAIYAGLGLSLMWSDALIWLWLLPMLLGQPFLRLYLLAEHGRCPPVANMLENTRTTFTNRLVRFLAWNMPYHIEHHSAPNVPFHKLPELHHIMKDDLVTTAPGYAAFTKSYASELT